MKRVVNVTASALLLGVLGLVGCSSETPSTEGDRPVATADAQEPAGGDSAVGGDSGASNSSEADGDSGNGDGIIPERARAASADFPFPVPNDWSELEPFHETKTGQDKSMSASYTYPGDAESAAETYRQLLESAGFIIHPHPLGELTYAASFVAEGKVNGISYKGTLNFDSNQRVAINLTED